MSYVEEARRASSDRIARAGEVAEAAGWSAAWSVTLDSVLPYQVFNVLRREARSTPAANDVARSDEPLRLLAEAVRFETDALGGNGPWRVVVEFDGTRASVSVAASS